jgi:hypothetical protein
MADVDNLGMLEQGLLVCIPPFLPVCNYAGVTSVDSDVRHILRYALRVVCTFSALHSHL